MGNEGLYCSVFENYVWMFCRWDIFGNLLCIVEDDSELFLGVNDDVSVFVFGRVRDFYVVRFENYWLLCLVVVVYWYFGEEFNVCIRNDCSLIDVVGMILEDYRVYCVVF